MNEMKVYRKQLRGHRKRLRETIAKDYDYDWRYAQKIFLRKLENMLEFFRTGANIVQAEGSREKIVEELSHAVLLGHEILTLDESGEDRSLEQIEAKVREFYGYIGENLLGWWD